MKNPTQLYCDPHVNTHAHTHTHTHTHTAVPEPSAHTELYIQSNTNTLTMPCMYNVAKHLYMYLLYIYDIVNTGGMTVQYDP